MSENQSRIYHNYTVTEVFNSETFIYTWRIINFISLPTKSNKCSVSSSSTITKNTEVCSINNIVSKKVDQNQLFWNIDLFPYGFDNYSSSSYHDYLAANIQFNKSVGQLNCNADSLSVYIISKDDAEKKVYESKNCNGNILIKNLIQRNVLLNENKGLLSNGDLTLKFKLKLSANTFVNKHLKSDYLLVCENTPKSVEYESILNNKQFSDAKIVIGTKVFYVYKGILATQSPVFAAMFEHSMKEKIENVLEVKDIQYEIMQELLRFMYAGKVNNIKNISFDLLIAADKYEVKELKKMCEYSLIETLSINNVNPLLIYADKYRANKLKTRAIEFFTFHVKELAQKEEFKKNLNILLPLLPDILMSLTL